MWYWLDLGDLVLLLLICCNFVGKLTEWGKAPIGCSWVCLCTCVCVSVCVCLWVWADGWTCSLVSRDIPFSVLSLCHGNQTGGLWWPTGAKWGGNNAALNPTLKNDFILSSIEQFLTPRHAYACMCTCTQARRHTHTHTHMLTLAHK